MDVLAASWHFRAAPGIFVLLPGIFVLLLAFSDCCSWHFRAIELLKAFEIERKSLEPAGDYARWDSIIYDGIT